MFKSNYQPISLHSLMTFEGLLPGLIDFNVCSSVTWYPMRAYIYKIYSTEFTILKNVMQQNFGWAIVTLS